MTNKGNNYRANYWTKKPGILTALRLISAEVSKIIGMYCKKSGYGTNSLGMEMTKLMKKLENMSRDLGT